MWSITPLVTNLHCCPYVHTVMFQIEHNRLELLQHPLVEDFLFQKFWVMTFPLFVFNLLFYCSLMVALNSFALVVPRPGPDSETCKISEPLVVGIMYCFYCMCSVYVSFYWSSLLSLCSGLSVLLLSCLAFH